MERHRKRKHHQAGLQKKNRFQTKETFLQSDQQNFKKKLVSSFQAADFPLYRLNHPAVTSLFAMKGNVLPSETASMASVAQLAFHKEN